MVPLMVRNRAFASVKYIRRLPTQPAQTLHTPRAKLANVRFAQANGATLNTMLTMANMPSSHSKPAVINVAEIG